MLLGVDGFDWADVDKLIRKYSFAGFYQSVLIDGRQPPNRIGGGYGLHMFNAAFDLMVQTRYYPARSTLVMGMNGYIAEGCDPSTVGNLFVRWESGPDNSDRTNDYTQLAVGYNHTGHLEFWAGGDGSRGGGHGTLVATTSYTMPLNVWQYLEFEIGFGPGGHIKAWAENALILNATGINVSNATHPADPDRMSWMLQNFGAQGMRFDDHYLLDTLGGVNDARLGPCRVSTVFPTSDGPVQWARNHGGGNYACVKDPGGFHGPDDAATELTGTPGQLDLYRFNPVPCFGRVHGVALNVCGHGVGGAGAVDLVCQPGRSSSTRVDLVSGAALADAYATSVPTVASVAQGIIDRPGRAVWTASDIASALWGIRAAGGVPVKSTQVFLEQLVSTRAGLSFSCGGIGSYAI